MSYYDVAVGINQNGLNTTMNSFFSSSTAQQKIFNGNVTETLGSLGAVNLAYQVKTSPAASLAPPSQADWDLSYKATGVTTMPASNVFQLTLNTVAIQVTYGKSTLKADGLIKAYAHYTLANNVLTLTPLAVWIDESAFSSIDKMIVNKILIPEILKLVTASLASIPLPQIPDFAGQTFQPPIAQIIDATALVAATASGATPVDLSGYTSPAQDIYVLLNARLLNSVLANVVDGQTVKEEGSKGPASGRISATVTSLVAGIDNGNTEISVSLSDVSGYGELAGTGVGVAKAVLCPIGAAMDAISNPSDWDKVISNFSISYSPDPLPVPVTLTASTSDGKQSLSVAVGTLSSIQVTAAPQWSGSVTGTVLAAAAAGFVDLLSVIFGKLIINKVLASHAQNINVFTLPDISTSIEGITVQLVIPDGTIAAVHGTSEWIQPFSVKFP